MLNLVEIRNLKKNETIIITYKLIVPQHIIDRQYSNPLINPKLKPVEHSIKGTIVSNGPKRIKIELEDSRVLNYDHSDFANSGSRGVDSQFYMVFDK